MTGTRRYGFRQGEKGIAPFTDEERVRQQIIDGKVVVGPDAARKIARRLTDEGGCWGPRKEGA